MAGARAHTQKHSHLYSAVLSSQAADLSHTPHSCLSDTSSEVTNTKETHSVSNITETSEGEKCTTKQQLHKSVSIGGPGGGVHWGVNRALLAVGISAIGVI